MLILDLDMPRLGGEGVLAALEERGLLDRIRVTIVTARPRALLGHLSHPIIAKPFDLDQLLAAVVGAPNVDEDGSVSLSVERTSPGG